MTGPSNDLGDIDPLLHEGAANPAVTDLFINGCGQYRFKLSSSKGPPEYKTGQIQAFSNLSPEAARRLVLEWATSIHGNSWDAQYPFIQWMHGPHRIHLSVWPITASAFELSVRFHRMNGVLTSKAGLWSEREFRFLQRAWMRREPMCIAGPTGSGKTTLLRNLLFSEELSRERVIAIEDQRELSPHTPGFISLLTRPANSDGKGKMSASTLLKEALRMSPDRLLMGEVRADEIVDLVNLAFTGHCGVAFTFHARQSRPCLTRLELLLSLACAKMGVPLSADSVRAYLAQSLKWLIVLEDHRIAEISEVAGIENGKILLRFHSFLEANPSAMASLN